MTNAPTRIAQVLRQLDREVWILTAATADSRGGLVITSLAQASISLEHPRVCVGIAKQHHTWKLIESSQAFALHLLHPEQVEWVWRFGLCTGSTTDKFAGLDVASTSTGSPRLVGALAWLDCRVETSLDIGDRTIYLAEIIDGELAATERPLTVTSAVQQASPAQHELLKSQLAADAARDAVAIEAWRSLHGLPGS